jgi:selenocysteine lyase/cysteine desulfurase
LSFIASGLNFRKGDNILIYHDDYPSNVYPWMALAARGVQVRLLNTRGLGSIRPVDVMGQVDENTRLVALASCHFISGCRLNHNAIGKFLRERGILFCLDAIQTVGAWPTTVENVDFLAADAHKWLLGPCAAGIMYVRRELQEKLNPPVYGWHNVRSPNFVAQDKIEFRHDARKFEAGTHNLLGLTGLIAALELALEPFEILNPKPEPEIISGITSIFQPGKDLTPLHSKLTQAGIVTSLRADRKGQQYIRFSPHFYNTDEELQRAVELL